MMYTAILKRMSKPYGHIFYKDIMDWAFPIPRCIFGKLMCIESDSL